MLVPFACSSGVRHPEELSFCKPISPDDLKYNYAERQMKKVQMAKTPNGQVSITLVLAKTPNGHVSITLVMAKIPNGRAIITLAMAKTANGHVTIIFI